MFVMGAFELPTAFLFPKLLRRFGSGRLLLISAVFGTLKAVALLCTFNYAGVLLAQPLQLLGYGLFTPASVYFVNESVPEADRVRGQTVMMVASNGMGGMLGGLLAAGPWIWAAQTGCSPPVSPAAAPVRPSAGRRSGVRPGGRFEKIVGGNHKFNPFHPSQTGRDGV